MATKTNSSINGKDYFRLQRVVDGKKKSFYGRSKKEAEKKYERYLLGKNALHTEADLSLFSYRAEEYIDSVLKTSQRYAQGTVMRYTSAYYTHINGTFIDRMKISDISPSDIQKFYNELSVSKQTLGQIHRFMSAFYKWLIRCGYATDVLSAVELPLKPDAKRHEEIITWSEEEIESITEHIGEHRLRFFIYVLLYTGARTGEAIALKYADFDKDTLHIKRQAYEGEIKKPKANSVRDIPIHPILKGELDRHRKWHRKEMREHGYKTDFVFTTDTGNILDARNVRRSLKRFYERNGILPKHTHAYRSTFCTQLCKCGTPIEVASSLLGHKSIEVTARHYAQVQPQTKKDAISHLHYETKEIKKR